MIESRCITGFGNAWGGQYHQQNRVYEMGDIALAQTSQLNGGSYWYLEVKEMTDTILLGLMEGFEQVNRVYDPNGLCPCMTIMQGGQRAENNRGTENGEIQSATSRQERLCLLRGRGAADLNYPSSKTRRGRVIDQGRICPTLATEKVPNILEKFMYEIDGVTYLVRIRKLTPKECWRLMGFTDEDYEKAAEVNSQTNMYKQAGNSIAVPVLEHIFREML